MAIQQIIKRGLHKGFERTTADCSEVLWAAKDLIVDLIKADPTKAAAALGLTVGDLPDPQDPTGLLGIMDVIEQSSITSAINEGWLVMGAITAVALVVLFVMGPIRVPASAPAAEARP